MVPTFIIFFIFGVCSKAQQPSQAKDILTEFEECLPDATENTDDITSLIQKKVVVIPADASSLADNGNIAQQKIVVAAPAEAKVPHIKLNVQWVWPWSNWHYDKHKSIFRNVYRSWDVYLMSTIITWIIWVVLALLVWNCAFPSQPLLFHDPDDPIETFQTQHFGCFKRSHICLCATCCPAVQWADTMHLAGFLKVYIALPIFFFCSLLNGLLGGFYAFGIFTSILIAVYRQRLRQELGLKSWTCTVCFFDCLYVCCCPCCAIAQEAQVVRYAYQSGGVQRSVSNSSIQSRTSLPAPTSPQAGPPQSRTAYYSPQSHNSPSHNSLPRSPVHRQQPVNSSSYGGSPTNSHGTGMSPNGNRTFSRYEPHA